MYSFELWVDSMEGKTKKEIIVNWVDSMEGQTEKEIIVNIPHRLMDGGADVKNMHA